MSNIEKSVDIIKTKIKDCKPEFAAILGSGLSGVADYLDNKQVISYDNLSGFPVPKVKGHAGEMIIGSLEGKDVIFLKGRVHLYEGDVISYLKTMIRTIKAIGVKNLLITNAAGSLQENVTAGSLVAISDHINLTGTNPLVGDNDDEWGDRFPSMDNIWDKDLRQKLKESAKKEGIELHEGVYAGVLGPSFETHAEVRMIKNLGADLVGMSTVAESIIARHCGLNIAGISVVTNLGAGMQKEALSHEQTLRDSKLGYDNIQKLIKAFVKSL